MTTNIKAAEADAEVKVTSKGVMKKESHREAKRHSHRKKRKKDSPEDICRPKATFQKLGHRNHTAFEVPVSVTSRPYRKIIQDFTVSSPSSYSSSHHLPLVPSSFPISPASSCRSSPNRLLPLLLFLLLHNHVGLMTDAFGEISGTENEVTQVEVVSGFNASLPCTIRIPVDDAPLLTLWYLEENETPIYSYDQRTGVSGTSWADKGVFGGRAHYLAHLSPPVMLIMRASIKDERLYRCRIDFHNSNSRETWVRLRVIVPPERVQITSQFSPVRLGQRDDVVCTAIGGKPPPSVVWLQRGIAVDPNSTVGQSGSFNWLEIPASREDLDSPFTCQATNNNLTPPVFALYIRNVTCGPTRILFEASDSPLLVGKAATITCKAFGSNPPARVTWYHQGKLIQKLTINVTIHGTETVSVLHLQPGRHHHMRQLLCRAENPLLPLETLEDIITLNVAYRPHVRVNLGWPRRLELLTEGSDLFLECIVDANPPPYKIEFFQNGVALNPNSSGITILKEATLAIHHVTRDHSGDYHCKASNVQGDSSSKNISVHVKYVPICALNESTIGAQIGQTVSLTCLVHAYPTDVNFTWMFVSDARDEEQGGGGGGGRGGGGIPRVIDALQYTCEGLSSTLHLTPKSSRDFGVLSCYGTNKNGIQQQPCTFNLVPEGLPEVQVNCSIAKVSSNEVTVACDQAKSNSQRQQFLHQVRLSSSGELVLNKSSSQATVELSSLEPNRKYIVSVSAVNARGKTPVKNFHIQTHREAKMQISLPSRPKPRKFLWIMGIGLGIVLTVVALLVGLWMARGRRSSHTLRNPDIDTGKAANNTALAGEAGVPNDGLCVNGLMHQTIYDSSGRYRGFAYMQQSDTQGPGMVCSSATPTSAPKPPDNPGGLQSRLSLLKRDSPLTKASKDASEVPKTNAENEAKARAAQQQDGTPGKEEEEGRKTGFVKWKWVVNHVTSGSEGNRFLDLCRLAQNKHVQDETKSGESVL